MVPKPLKYLQTRCYRPDRRVLLRIRTELAARKEVAPTESRVLESGTEFISVRQPQNRLRRHPHPAINDSAHNEI